MVPSAFESFCFEAGFELFFGFEKVQGDSTEPGEVFGAVAGANTPVIIAKADVQRPMQSILDTPMITNVL